MQAQHRIFLYFFACTLSAVLQCVAAYEYGVRYLLSNKFPAPAQRRRHLPFLLVRMRTLPHILFSYMYESECVVRPVSMGGCGIHSKFPAHSLCQFGHRQGGPVFSASKTRTLVLRHSRISMPLMIMPMKTITQYTVSRRDQVFAGIVL